MMTATVRPSIMIVIWWLVRMHTLRNARLAFENWSES